ncbi:DUF2018 family protein [Sulfurospirillum sp. T05]|uniref:DUF2018 family protein n=1 Tax=Sulfurospirillum tamanense TaxID=2813362 RepID=A0ABS2WRE8_9BACT|nr:DUF2018 family protein [Sulfurospirillum tamanensis]MBN2964177.1 DUF2018 family protein [Sulfurospirillum tamanensis]
MLKVDENDPFLGSPKSKFFDILLHANRSVVEHEFDLFLDRHLAIETLLSERLGEDESLESLVKAFKYERQDDLEAGKTDMYINLVGDILTQNE